MDDGFVRKRRNESSILVKGSRLFPVGDGPTLVKGLNSAWPLAFASLLVRSTLLRGERKDTWGEASQGDKGFAPRHTTHKGWSRSYEYKEISRS